MFLLLHPVRVVPDELISKMAEYKCVIKCKSLWYVCMELRHLEEKCGSDWLIDAVLQKTTTSAGILLVYLWFPPAFYVIGFCVNAHV